MSGFLEAAAAAPIIHPTDLVGTRPLVILAPHPDDETLGCGALLFDCAAAGVPCTVICVTDGSRSHPNSRAYPAMALADLRRGEFEAAVSMLAPYARTHWLGLPDCGIPPDAGIVDLLPPNALLLATWEGDPHIDHEMTARLAARAAAKRPDIALMLYPVWGRFTDRCVPVFHLHASPAARHAKRAALACHRSQMTSLIQDDPEGFVMEDWRQQHFLETEEIVIAP